MNEDYKIPGGVYRVEQKIKGSRFIATCDHVESAVSAKAFIYKVRREFKDASHNCFAFVAGAPGSVKENGMSDDGEPGGTAGSPMLNALVHSDVGEVAVVVTRYFGGTKLGTGGLVRAYSSMVREVLDQMPVTIRRMGTLYLITAGYSEIDRVKIIVAKNGAGLIAEEYTEKVVLEVLVPASKVDTIRAALPYSVGFIVKNMA